MKPKISKPRQPAIDCPHCGQRMIVRNSEVQTATSRELRLACTNDDCRAVLNGQLVLISTRVPSACPNAAIVFAADRRKAANDDTPTPANDPGPLTPAATDMGG